MASNANKQRGYRIRQTIFVPTDGADLTKTKAAIEFAEGRNKLPEGAPAGTVIEDFSVKPGMKETA